MTGALLLAGLLAAATYFLDRWSSAPRPAPVRIETRKQHAEN